MQQHSKSETNSQQTEHRRIFFIPSSLKNEKRLSRVEKPFSQSSVMKAEGEDDVRTNVRYHTLQGCHLSPLIRFARK